MNFKGIKILVLDGFVRQVNGILESMHDLGCEITTFNLSRLDIGFASKYPKHKILFKKGKDNKEELYKEILNEIMSGKYDAVFPISDETTSFIMDNYDEISKKVKICAAKPEPFRKAYNKQITMEMCQLNGIPCPITRMTDEPIEDFLKRCSFPLAIKPREGTGSVGYHKIDTKEQLMKYIDSGEVVPNDYIIQEFISHDGKHFDTYIFMDENHECVTKLAGNKIRWFPVDAGSACLIGTVDNEEILDYSVKLLKAIDWSCFAQIYWIVDPKDNLPKVIEINGRIPASIKICPLCGYNIVQQELELAFGEKVTKFNPPFKEQYLRYFQTDFLWFIKSKNRFKAKPRWFFPSKTKDYIFSWRDPWPFFAYSLQCIFRYKKDMKKRKH